jgi:hypothetical protein
MDVFDLNARIGSDKGYQELTAGGGGEINRERVQYIHSRFTSEREKVSERKSARERARGE